MAGSKSDAGFVPKTVPKAVRESLDAMSQLRRIGRRSGSGSAALTPHAAAETPVGLLITQRTQGISLSSSSARWEAPCELAIDSRAARLSVRGDPIPP